MSNAPIEIDGSYKEGGGQILRNSISYAVLLQKSVTIANIRANRPKNPGVRPQHLTGMRLAVEIGNASVGKEGEGRRGELVGAEVGAKTVSYAVHPVTPGAGAVADVQTESFVADTGTAGSIALLLQAALLPGLARAIRRQPSIPPANPSVTIELKGGTNATGAPQIDYVTDVFAPFINSYLRQNCGSNNQQSSEQPPIDIQVIKRGYYPRGGGIVRVNLRPPTSRLGTFPPIKLTTVPPIKSITIKAFHAGNCPAWVAEKMAQNALKELRAAWQENVQFRDRFVKAGGTANETNATSMSPIVDGANVQVTHEKDCLGSGSGILIVAYPHNPQNDDGSQSIPYPALAASALGDRKVRPQQTGSNAAKELIECIVSGGCVDRWLQDQLVPFMALADDNEKSEVLVGELTLHTQTAMWVAEKMTGCKFEVEKLDQEVMDHSTAESDSQHYGENGRVWGRHIIRCHGVGFAYN